MLTDPMARALLMPLEIAGGMLKQAPRFAPLSKTQRAAIDGGFVRRDWIADGPDEDDGCWAWVLLPAGRAALAEWREARG